MRLVARVLDGDASAPEVGRHELVAELGAGEAVPRDEGAVEPGAGGVLDVVVVGVGEAEVVGVDAVLVVDHLGVGGAVPPHVRRRLDLVVAVLRRRHELRRPVPHPHRDVLPVVPVAPQPEERRVLLEVVVVDVRAPPVVAPLPRVHVVVRQVRRVAAPVGVARARVQSLRRVALRVDRRHVVATVRVEVHCGLKTAKAHVGQSSVPHRLVP